MAKDQARFIANITAILENKTTVVDFSGEQELMPEDFQQIEAALAANITASIVSCLKFNDCNLFAGSAPYLARIIVMYPKLLKLYLDKNHLNDHGVQILAEAICASQFKSLRTLSLCENFITATGAKALSVVIAIDTLHELILDDNRFNNDGIENLFAMPSNPVAHYQNNNLILLSLRTCDIHPAGAQAMAKVIGSFRSLTFLYLNLNPLYDAGIIHLIRPLMHSGLRELHLEGCGLGNDAALVLGEMLQTSRCLNVLNIGANKFTRNGFVYGANNEQGLIVGAVQSRSLAVLGLAENNLGDQEMDVIEILMARSYSLEDLDLNGNSITDLGVTKLAHGLELSPRVMGLRLDGNLITDVGAQAVLTVLQAKRADEYHDSIEVSIDCEQVSPEMQQLIATYDESSDDDIDGVMQGMRGMDVASTKKKGGHRPSIDSV